MISRRTFVCATLSLILAPLAAEAQQTSKVYRIGMLSPTPRPAPSQPTPREDAFRQEMRNLGWIEDQNWVSETRWADGKLESLAALATELVRLKVDLILTVGTPAARAAKLATQTIPIVMASSGDAVGLGLVTTLARPGGNVTGLSFLGRELAPKLLEFLKATVPTASRAGVLWDLSIGGPALKQAMERSASALGLRLQPLEPRSADDYRAAFSAMSRARAEALVVLPMGTASTHQALIAELAAKQRLPTVCGETSYVEAGGLMSYGPNFADLHRRAAHFVDKILKGARPADLPVEQPTKFELVINLKTAKALGLTIPQSVLLRADQIIPSMSPQSDAPAHVPVPLAVEVQQPGKGDDPGPKVQRGGSMTIDEVLRFLEIVLWPLVALVAVLVIRPHLGALLGGAKVKLTLHGLTFEITLPELRQVLEEQAGEPLSIEHEAYLASLQSGSKKYPGGVVESDDRKFLRPLRNSGLILAVPRNAFLEDATEIELSGLGRLYLRAKAAARKSGT